MAHIVCYTSLQTLFVLILYGADSIAGEINILNSFTPAAPAQDITSAVGFCRALVSVMKLKPGGVVCAGVVCSSWITLNRYSAGFFCMIKGAFLESPTLGFDIEIMQDAFSPGPFSHLRRNERTFEKTADGSEDTWLHGQACFWKENCV